MLTTEVGVCDVMLLWQRTFWINLEISILKMAERSMVSRKIRRKGAERDLKMGKILDNYERRDDPRLREVWEKADENVVDKNYENVVAGSEFLIERSNCA